MLQLVLYFLNFRASPFSSIVELGLILSAIISFWTMKYPCLQNHAVVLEVTPTTKTANGKAIPEYCLTLESPAQLCEAQTVNCGFEAGPPQLLNDPKNMPVILLYFHGFEVLKNPGWIVHSLLTLSPSFSSVSLSASAKMKLLMDSWVTLSWYWWIAVLFAACSSCLCSSVCWTDRVHKSFWEGKELRELWPHLGCAHVAQAHIHLLHVADLCGMGISDLAASLPHAPIWFEKAGLEGLGTCCFSFCSFLSVHRTEEEGAVIWRNHRGELGQWLTCHAGSCWTFSQKMWIASREREEDG